MKNPQSEPEKNPNLEIPEEPKKRFTALKVGLLIGSLHLFFVLFNVIDIIRRHEGQWNMFWIVCDHVDFPVSLLLSKIILPKMSVYLHFTNPYMAGSRGIVFAVFLLFHTLVGSAWYCVLPMLVHKAAIKIAHTTKAVVAAIAMMIIPIPSHWLQILRFLGHHTESTAIGLNCVLPGLWSGLFGWLLLTNKRRKGLLWLFFLTPVVFYYLAYDIYCYFMMRR